MTMNSIIARSALAVAATLVAQPLFAAPLPDTSERSARTPTVIIGESSTIRTNHVSYANLNLATAAGENRLNRRLKAAVRLVCDDSLAPGDHFDALKCRKAALASAQPQVALVVQRAREAAAAGSPNIAATIGIASSK